MDFRSCMKAILVALTLLSMVTWFPQVYTCLSALFIESFRSVVSDIVTPKYLFVFSNIIVVFLVSESKLSRNSSEPRIIDNNTTGRDDGMVHDSQKQEKVMVTEALLPVISKYRKLGLERNMVIMEVEEEQYAENEVLMMEEVTHSGVHQVDEVREEEEEDRADPMSVLGEEMSAGLVKEDWSAEEEWNERSLLPADELNRRVEDFIARFNMERHQEAWKLVGYY